MANKKITKHTQNLKVWLIFVILFLTNIATVCYVISLNNDYHLLAQRLLSQTINDAEKRRYTQPVISVSENRVYIPEFRIFTTLSKTSRKLVYSTSSNPTVLYLSVNGVVGNQNSSDDPQCDRMIAIRSSKTNFTNEKYIGEIAPVSDGLRYIYQSSRSCSIYSAGDLEGLAQAARSITQY